MSHTIKINDNKFIQLENELLEIKAWLSKADNMGEVRSGVLTFGKHLDNVLKRLEEIELILRSKFDTSNYLSSEYRGEFHDELSRIENLLENLVKEVLGPESSIKYDENQAKYIITEGSIIEKINKLREDFYKFERNFYISETGLSVMKYPVEEGNENEIYIEYGLKIFVHPDDPSKLIIRRPGINTVDDLNKVLDDDIQIEWGAKIIMNNNENNENNDPDTIDEN
jgi:hypothetical protein